MIRQRDIIMFMITLSFLGGAFAFGFHKGTVNQIQKFAEEKQQLQTDILDLEADIAVKAAEIVRLNSEKEGLINELEQAALNAEGASAPGVATTGGLQRLERRWGPSTISP